MLHATTPDLNQARLRHHLEMQSLVIEEIVGQFLLRPLSVSGGDVRVDKIWYELPAEDDWGVQAAPMRTMEQELQQRLGTTAQVRRWQGGLRVGVERPSPPVDLLSLMQQYQVPEKGAVTAVLGLDEGGQPILLDLPQVGHVLITGEAASGKTSLLQTIAASLVLTNRPSQLQLLVIQNLTDSGLRMLDGLPSDYLLRPVVTTANSAVQALTIIAGRLDSLPVGFGKGPHIVILIDQIETLLDAANFAVLAPIVRLLGVSGAISLVVSSRQPQNDLLGYCNGRWGARIVGRLADGTQTERLLGDGAFLMLRRGEQTARYFQAAFTDRYDLSFLRTMVDD